MSLEKLAHHRNSSLENVHLIFMYFILLYIYIIIIINIIILYMHVYA